MYYSFFKFCFIFLLMLFGGGEQFYFIEPSLSLNFLIDICFFFSYCSMVVADTSARSLSLGLKSAKMSLFLTSLPTKYRPHTSWWLGGGGEVPSRWLTIPNNEGGLFGGGGGIDQHLGCYILPSSIGWSLWKLGWCSFFWLVVFSCSPPILY